MSLLLLLKVNGIMSALSAWLDTIKLTKAQLQAAQQLYPGAIFSDEAVYQESLRLREVYVDAGYVFSQVVPATLYNKETGKVDVTFTITENDIAYIGKVNIRGNVRTKDEVIRRELRCYPGERYDGRKMRKSRQRLENLGFFEDIRFGAEPEIIPTPLI